MSDKKTISLKKPERTNKEQEGIEFEEDKYPSFTIYGDAPAELMDMEIDQEFTAKIRLNKKEKEERKNGDDRHTVGFEVLSVEVKAPDEIADARKKGNDIAKRIKDEGF